MENPLQGNPVVDHGAFAQAVQSHLNVGVAALVHNPHAGRRRWSWMTKGVAQHNLLVGVRLLSNPRAGRHCPTRASSAHLAHSWACAALRRYDATWTPLATALRADISHAPLALEHNHHSHSGRKANESPDVIVCAMQSAGLHLAPLLRIRGSQIGIIGPVACTRPLPGARQLANSRLDHGALWETAPGCHQRAEAVCGPTLPWRRYSPYGTSTAW